MLRITRYTLVAATITLTLLGCRDAAGPTNAARPVTAKPMLSDATEGSAPLIRYIVAPQATDDRIDGAVANHYVWLDTAARSNHKLFLFLPSGRSAPDTFQLVGQEAARLGYHVISLMYQNDLILVALCGAAAARSAADGSACYESARLDIIDGRGRSAAIPELAQAGFAVSEANSIDNRLTRLLDSLDAWHPGQGWSRFLVNGAPKWSRIAVGGHSQGGGEAAMIAKIRLVPRVVMFSSVPDTVPAGQAPAWISSHKTPSHRYFALAHDCDQFFRSIVASWDSLGMNASVASSPRADRPGTFCRNWTSTSRNAPVAPEHSAPPYGGTHVLITDLQPQVCPPPPAGAYKHRCSHQSTASDLFTPRNPVDGTPLLRDAWRYLLGTPPEDDDDGDDNAAQVAGDRDRTNASGARHHSVL